MAMRRAAITCLVLASACNLHAEQRKSPRPPRRSPDAVAIVSPLDRWNHSAKAVAYGLLNWLGQVEWKKKPTTFNRLNKKALGVAEQWDTKK